MSEIVALESLVPADVFKAGGGDPIVDSIRSEVLAVHTDISTEDGREGVRKLAYKVARSKTFLDDMGKTFAADLKQKVKAIDSERARIWDALDALQKEVRKPLTDFEETEKARVAGHEAVLLMIENTVQFDGLTPSPADLKQRLQLIGDCMQRDWQEFDKRAAETCDRIRSQLEKLLAERQKYEEEQKELDRLRKAEADRLQREREERLKAEAAEKATREAEVRAKAEAEAAEQKARQERESIERQKREAEERAAKAQAEIERQQREAVEAAVRAEREKDAAVQKERERADAEKKAHEEAAAKREADKQHRAKINNEALTALVESGLSEEHAKLAIEAIARRQIPNVSISY